MEPRARVSVWPGRRRVPGIVAPDSWGARGVECLPRDVLRRSSPATSPCDGTTVRRCLCHGTGSGTTEARPPQAVYPGRLMGVWGFYRATWSIPGRIFGAQDKWCQVLKISGVSSVFNENRTDTTCFVLKTELTPLVFANCFCADDVLSQACNAVFPLLSARSPFRSYARSPFLRRRRARTHPPCGLGSGCPAGSSRNRPSPTVLGLHLPRGSRPGGGVRRRRKDSCPLPRAKSPPRRTGSLLVTCRPGRRRPRRGWGATTPSTTPCPRGAAAARRARRMQERAGVGGAEGCGERTARPSLVKGKPWSFGCA